MVMRMDTQLFTMLVGEETITLLNYFFRQSRTKQTEMHSEFSQLETTNNKLF